MADPVEEAAESLYGLPLDEFTSARNAAAKELRDRGLRAEADEVKALAKPSVAAWAVNQLTRRRHADLDEFLDAAEAAREAQLGGTEEEPRAAQAGERRAHKRGQQAQADAEGAAEQVEKARRELEQLRR